ncbi:MAG: VanZ family protein [bacterium]|nr:VanZ family protein [bacterium]
MKAKNDRSGLIFWKILLPKILVNTKCRGGKGFLFLWFPAVGYAALIFYLSSLSHTRPLPFSFSGSDKIIHFFEYLGFAFLMIRALHDEKRLSPRARLLAAFFLAAAYGASDEFHQYFVPGRECSGFDLLADMGGSAAGIYFFDRMIRALRIQAVPD